MAKEKVNKDDTVEKVAVSETIDVKTEAMKDTK